MTENRDDSLVPWEKALDRLVGMAGSNKKRAFQRPSEVAIRAYLHGTPTQAQKREVRTALSESAEFRLELLEMIEEMEEWADPETAHSAEQVHVDLIPDLRAYLPESQSADEIWNRIKAWLNTPLLLPAAVGRSIAVVLRPRVLAPSLMAAVLVTLIAVQQFQTGPTWELAISQVAKEKLISTSLRQGAHTEAKVYNTAEDAALASFRSLLVYSDRKFSFRDSIVHLPPQGETVPVMIRLTDTDGTILAEFSSALPTVDGSGPQSVQVWVLSLPSRSLRSIRMTSDSAVLELRDELGFGGCVTFTYKIESGYKAAASHTFSLQ